MKKFGTYTLLFCTCFAGIFAAIRFERWTEARKEAEPIGFISAPPAIDAQYTPGTPFDFRVAAKRIMPAVVSVDKAEAWRDMWSDQVSIVPAGTGSGVIISPDGYILTNNHVVEQAATLTVRLSDGKSYTAKLIGTDPRTDLAVIKVDAPNLKVAELADSSKLDVGQWVMAVGNPLGYSNTVSVGVVSSLNRSLQAGERGALLVDAIQTDAAINGGNSGGALTNDQGQVVGINTAIASPTGSNIGIGFAIPINRAKRVVADIVKYGHVKYGYSGFEVYNSPAVLKDNRARRFIQRSTGAEPPQEGLIVNSVDPGSPAADATMAPLDVITEADGKKIDDPATLLRLMLEKKEGDSVQIKVWHAGKTRDVTLKLGNEPSGA